MPVVGPILVIGENSRPRWGSVAQASTSFVVVGAIAYRLTLSPSHELGEEKKSSHRQSELWTTRHLQCLQIHVCVLERQNWPDWTAAAILSPSL